MKMILIGYFLFPLFIAAQVTGSLTKNNAAPGDNKPGSEYRKPKFFSFVTDIPSHAAGFTRQSFQKKNLKYHVAICLSTAMLYWADQSITNAVQDKMKDWNISAAEQFSPLLKINIGGEPTNIGKLPKNINTAIYDIGQGSTVIWLAAGFYIAGKIKRNNRALTTASQLTEAFLTLGIGTQIMKYASGRENPSDATMPRGRWQPFPGWQDFQQYKTKYDAFPSGHLATFVSAVTIIGENYPEKKWIKPLGYSIAALCGLSMINNGVHWASDFPLAIALGHGYGKFIARKARRNIVSL